MNFNIESIIPFVILGFFVFIIAIIILRRILVNVGAREIAIKERRYFGQRMPPGRVVATEGEAGIQADVLKPGLHLIKWPFEKGGRNLRLLGMGSGGMGSREAVDAEPNPPGRIFAPARAQN